MNHATTGVGNSLATGITLHTGITGDKDVLLVLDLKLSQSLTYEQGIEALYQFGKQTGKPVGSFQKVQVDLNFNQSGKLMILQEHYDPRPCDGEVVHCSPNDTLIEYVKK